ncbi:ATP-binding sensor histidine kinase [Nostoc sp. TCL26-01]|uniref:trifunctional serine/threonine-protein kinase/ATP-binding protein/sensor histidine kinase n=1 Tax=Nostoc sp. TCL26-01 TaxID=2576904 RepID=UPI0015BE2E11|nr:ATP-binding sensor histidine kinase [Nostoc sp. TCL26-01]QLE54108.1 GAF domain-containing protein [Nostoc sp. TCL26-01]
MNPNTVSISGYQVNEEIYNGSRTVVYRGYRESDRLKVVIKLLKNHYPSFSELLAFRNQYTIAKNLNSPLIIQTYSLEPYQNGYGLIMEDFGGISLRTWGIEGKLRSLAEFLPVAIALCDALNILYHNRIIHKDIKPVNILINPDTQQVKLIDFSIASLLAKETQTFINPHILEGTLAYISPEQTGRMNRSIDYRTDFYSLGVTFYELLTGELPFISDDPMELVHCHLAKIPTVLGNREQVTGDREQVTGDRGQGIGNREEIPQVLSDIVMKLMAKNAEDRYQTALGLKFDLENCLHQLTTTGQIQHFAIAQRDVGDRFIIPDQLYGRETPVKTLLAAFERVSLGATEMMLVAGFSGIGKTAVVNEVHKPIVRQRGYFIKGKYDQFQRNIPFSAFLQAFRDLIKQLLTETDAQIQQWRNQILAALGDNAQVIIQVIPELSQIIGTQPPVPELSGTAAQNRFNLLFPKFTQVFTSAEHPLVIFIDDLQWADTASLNLIQLFMTDTKYLLLIGAYRDNEVTPGHPLISTLSDLAKTGVTINKITLAPLSQLQVNKLVADTLKCTESYVYHLSGLIYQKTKGNPFFTTQFLKALHQENCIQFDFELGCWQCDITQVNQQTLTDDVVAFMAWQLGKLPPSIQRVLQLAACIGNQFDLATLVIVSEQSEIVLATELWQALQAGLILPISDVYKFYQGEHHDKLELAKANTTQQLAQYKFLHDRVQQAAYSLIPTHQKQATHLKIGQLLQQNLSEIEQAEKLFDIVGHLNKARDLISQPQAQETLAQLNLKAGIKSRKSTAYAAAREYLQTGIELLQPNSWQHQYELTLHLHIAAAEVSYLHGDFDSLEQIGTLVLQKSQTILDKVKIYEIQIAAQTLQSNVLQAIAIGRKALSEFGIELPLEADEAKISQALQALATQLAGRQVADLIDLPLTTDTNTQAAMQVMGMLFAPIIQGMPSLLPLLSSTMVSLSLQSGNSVASTTGYAIHGMVMSAFLGDVITGYAFGKLALNLLEKLLIQELKTIVMFLFGCFIQHHQEELSATVPILKAAYHAGIETGNFVHAGYALATHSNARFFSGAELDSFVQDMTDYSVALAQVKQYSAQAYVDMGRQIAENLMQPVMQPHCLIGNAYNETVMLPKHQQDHDLTAIAELYIYKLLLAYCFGNYTDASNYIAQAQLYFMALSGTVYIPVFHFYAALTYLALFPTQPEIESAESLALAQTHQTILHQWAQNNPMNHLHKWYLVAAEHHRVLGEKIAAIECYDKAITLAKAHQFIHEEALANELAAKFYLDWSKERLAREHIIQAYYGYAHWGAKAKVAHLEESYPQLLAPILKQTRTTLSVNETLFTFANVTCTSSATATNHSIAVALDLAAILQASQTISSEIELEKLLVSLLDIVIENAGADKCVFMLMESDQLLIRALAKLDSNTQILTHSQPVEDSLDVPVGLIHTVKRSLEHVVITDATVHISLINDSYIQQRQPKSILCSPILHQGKLLAVLYLENNVTTGAFTSDRVELLNLLCTQTAISLENARLYRHSQNYAQQLEQSVAKLQANEIRFHNLANNIPGMVYQFRLAPDGSTSTPYVSSGCWDLYGLDPDEVMAGKQSLYTLHHPDDHPAIYQAIAYSAQNLTPFEQEWRIILPSGTVKWVQSAARPQREDDGAILWDGVVIDISDVHKELHLRKQAEISLQQAQLQIIQSEKMSALGNLVAGVAHEMNNPLGFMAASLKQAKPAIADIVEHLKLYQAKLPHGSDEINDHAREIDLDYSLEDLPKMLDAMTMACDRLKNISTSLRTFSRADKDYKVLFNIHEGIDSTILILKHRLKANEQHPLIEVIKNYGNLPKIECFPGQLNQVFMNIIANAIDALEESNHGRRFEEIKDNPNCITITTSAQEQQIQIVIADNGIGMTEQVKQKIFDHLFTTKAVGKGTGLGLAIARQIVEETHTGTLNCISVLAKGTEFVITLPVSTKSERM